MSVVLLDSCEHYATGDITTKWFTSGAFTTVEPTGGRRGGGCIVGWFNDAWVRYVVPSGAGFVVGFALKWSQGLAERAHQIAQLLDVVTTQAELWLMQDGTLRLTAGATAPDGTASTFSLHEDVWYFVEWEVDGTSSRVLVDGAQVLTGPGGAGPGNQIQLCGKSAGHGPFLRYDDIYIVAKDSVGLVAPLGDQRIDALRPVADGTYLEMSPSSGTAHWSLVNDAIVNDATFVFGAPGAKRDTYVMSDLEPIATPAVTAVQVTAAMWRDTAGARSGATMLRSASVDSIGTMAPLATARRFETRVWERNPDGNVAWTETSVNALQAGAALS